MRHDNSLNDQITNNILHQISNVSMLNGHLIYKKQQHYTQCTYFFTKLCTLLINRDREISIQVWSLSIPMKKQSTSKAIAPTVEAPAIGSQITCPVLAIFSIMLLIPDSGCSHIWSVFPCFISAVLI